VTSRPEAMTIVVQGWCKGSLERCCDQLYYLSEKPAYGERTRCHTAGLKRAGVIIVRRPV